MKRRSEQRFFSDCYDITGECLGFGICGSVRTVICKTTLKKYALKILKFKSVFEYEAAKKEVDAFNVGLGHKNFVQVKEIFKEIPYYYIVMEKLDKDLQDFCEDQGFKVKECDAARITSDVAKALKVFHDLGVAHRDIKPDNIFCSGSEIFPVKLGDYGSNSGFRRKSCCKNHGNDLFSDKVGTIDYMAPEVARLFLEDQGHYTKQCDMWSLGVLLYALLCGALPFVSDNLKNCQCKHTGTCSYCVESILNSIITGDVYIDAAWDEVSEEAQDLILNLIEPDLDKRFTIDQVLKHTWIQSHVQF